MPSSCMSSSLNDPGSHRRMRFGRKRHFIESVLPSYRSPAINRCSPWGPAFNMLASFAALSSASIAIAPVNCSSYRLVRCCLCRLWNGGISDGPDPYALARSSIQTFTSTFIYRNTAAVYFGLCAVLWLLFYCNISGGRLPLDSFLLEKRTEIGRI